jgi:hypothetical protein
MDRIEQNEWLTKHIPHRVRAAIARIDMGNSILSANTLIDPVLRNDEDRVYWRCSTDSIWEGRLTATRWLIEFVGIQQKGGSAIVYQKKRGSKDVRITDFDGGRLLSPSVSDGPFLASVWKGCSQAASHATNEYTHPSVDDRITLPKALGVLVDHLQNTIYSTAGKKIRDYVLERVP